MTFLILKAFHLIAVITWMAGLLYLYRLFIYHRGEEDARFQERLSLMESRLWAFITVPSAWLVFFTGLGLVATQPCFFLSQGWLWLKLLLSLLLYGSHFYAGWIRKSLRQGSLGLSTLQLRILNELPTLCMIAIVFLVVLKPALFHLPLCQ